MTIPYEPNESRVFGVDEKQVLLLLYIGRTQKIRGEASFNLERELERNGFLNTYESLIDIGAIETYDERKVSGADGTTTFEKCKLTGGGNSLYELYERSIENMLGSIPTEIFMDEVMAEFGLTREHK